MPVGDSHNNPVADHKAMVVVGNARFTVLTPQLIRMEWAEDGKFEDHASMVFINRRLPVPAFTRGEDGGWVTIKTAQLLLKYKKDSGKFTGENLSVEFTMKGQPLAWHPGMAETGNLGGTLRTLDGVKGSEPLPPGLLSRDGWTLVDDSGAPLYDDSDWPWVMERPQGNRQDWYFFAYGHEYRTELLDFTRVAGKIPLPPRFAFGTWWSRYWAYTDTEFEDLVRQFQTHNVPLDVLVVDMDWHPTFGVKWWENKKDPSGHTLGWTGYTWNPLYFPDPDWFLKWVHQQGLKTTLNMHPASGVQPFEKAYPEMARAMGIDPASKQYVPFDITDKKFAINYMNILHHPLEKEGVDFFWLDWQQEGATKIKGMNPTFWLNYVHFTDMEREGKRPLIYHRWGGLGNHRYEIGFSGDTISVWDSLAFQPYFTATAANVLYGYWSHDIGGHMPGVVAPELYARWIQWGAFSPILRTHTTKNPDAERRIWAYPYDYARVMREAYVLRYALIPYIYTSARESYDTGVAMLHPLYYDYPEAPEAYDKQYSGEYLYGDSMLVAPVTAPVDEITHLAKKSVWLPPGTWIEWQTGTTLQGPKAVERSFSLEQIPVYVKAGAIVPMEPAMEHTDQKPVDPLIVDVFPGDCGAALHPAGEGACRYKLYSDAGNTLGYKSGAFTWTTLKQERSGNSLRGTIEPAQGSYPGMLARRGYEIRVEDVLPPASVTYAGKEVPFSREEKTPSWRYDGERAQLIIRLPQTPTTVTTAVEIGISGDSAELNGFVGKLVRVKAALHELEKAWPQGWAPDSLLELSQTGNRISINPKTAKAELEKFNENLPKVVNEVRHLQDVDPKLVEVALAQLMDIQ
ncbi:MAG TPA: TIM-barrel domain-containing protein [Terriglobales bacterium]|nr:TIM-barrel domain-containing protein [Terriglobales bacterium]